jgi:hypothetical protein
MDPNEPFSRWQPGVPTWDDVQDEAMHCPVLQHMVTVAERGDVTRDQALTAAVLWLSRDRRRLLEQVAVTRYRVPDVPTPYPPRG